MAFVNLNIHDEEKQELNEDQLDMLNMLIEGRRLRDISDLPFDLAT
ncbi:MAG: NgoMIV family type II restriction endonuclease [Candidatus Vecturithrix sp.]|nr:NgoMIV family type II restriction endonuclease [Candidatus Vecturithrix sp.]